jgi:peptidyl-dipeptidase Dcp
LNKIHLASKPYASKEVEEIKSFAAKEGFKDELMPWDFSYYSEKLKNEKFGFEEEMLKPYFKLENVISGVFNLASTLYGIKFVEVNNIPVYHKDVKTYEVYDEEGKFLSVLYADLHPRESKQGGAWMTDYRPQSNINGNMIRPHISVCCNFPKPTENKPSLLTFNDVNTFLHEFGHALHGMLQYCIPVFIRNKCLQGFVNASQIMENWGN